MTPATILTGTPSTSTVSGYAWVYNTDLGGISIGSVGGSTWTFDFTITANHVQGGPIGNLWITVWSCTANSLVSCTFLFKNWDNTTNVLANTTPTKYTYTTGNIGPFSSVHFLSVEYWIAYTSAGNQGSLIATETTVSAASDVITPQWNYAQTLTGFLGSASLLAEKSSLFRTLSCSFGLTSSFAEKSSLFRSLTGSLGLASSLAVKNSVFRLL